MKPKLIAFYLPQFHTTEENDKWWGKGFTEWTNTKKAKPLFKKHYQPREPENDNYYCLLNSKDQEWQSQLALNHGIDAFCYYHYWFNGKLLLNKPMENMLNNKKIKINFCISWANEPWTRSWTGKNKEILLKQEYGDEDDWINHIRYLIPFFKDERYLKEDNKPILLLYRSNSIINCSKMIDIWEIELKKEGFNGIYLIETLTGHQKNPVLDKSNAAVQMEPMYTIRHDQSLYFQFWRLLLKKLKLYNIGIYDKFDYQKLWNKIICRKKTANILKGAFIDWDNTPRWGKKAMIVKNANPIDFKKNFQVLYNLCVKKNQKFIFINAWNEWAEGTYLEPDKRNETAYLKAIKEIVEE